MSFVDVCNLCFAYGGTCVLQNHSLTMSQGEIVGIVGPSGCGKSTLLRLIAGLEEPTDGSIEIAGQTVVNDATFVPPDRRGVGMVFQDYSLFPHLTVAENIEFGLHRWPRSKRKQRLREMLELVHLQGMEERYPHELSGGQQQRVALARALAPEPAILLMDEPFSSLDANLKAEIRTELREILAKSGTTCLLVSHDQQDVEAICDRAVVIGE